MNHVSSAPRRRFAQLSLRAALLLMAVAAIAVWWRWQKPFEAESSISKWKIDTSIADQPVMYRYEARKVETKKRQGFRDIVSHGPTRVFNDQGELIFEQEWRHGIAHGSYRIWDENSLDLVVDLEFREGRIIRVGANPVRESIWNLSLDGPESERIKRALAEETSFDYLGQQLSDIVDDISFAHNLPMRLDEQGMAEAGVASLPPVTLQLREVPLWAALMVLVAPLRMSCAYEYEQLWITTPESRLLADGNLPRVPPAEEVPHLKRVLQSEVNCDYLDQALVDVLEDLAYSHQITLVPDLPDHLRGLSVTLQLKGVSLRAALGTVLYQHDLDCELDGDKLIIVEPADRRPQDGEQS